MPPANYRRLVRSAVPMMLLLSLAIGNSRLVDGGQGSQSDDLQRQEAAPIYVKVVLPLKPTAKEHFVERWIARKLGKREMTELRAVTRWIRLAEPGQKPTSVWNASVDGKGWGCPVSGQISNRATDGKVTVRLSGWSPAGADVTGTTISAKAGSRGIARVDTGADDGSGRAYVALQVGQP